MSSLKYWVWLSSISGVGPVTAAHLLAHFETPEKVFLADDKDYRGIEGVKKSDIPRLAVKNIDSADKILASCAKIGCRVITLHDAEYPDRLRNIYDPPIVLYVKGVMPVIDEEPVVAVVGTRDCTSYGIGAAEGIGYALSQSGLIVATGLARGIDSAAARGALRGGGAVIGVIGSGLDIVYPSENKALFADVANSGAIISEYHPGTPALPAHFPARNRILSGISLGVAVIEAPKKSGALITAARALEQGRDVFTLPGNINAKSCEGSNTLLREGAIPILSADDIISEYAELFPDRICIKKEIDNKHTVDYIDLDKIKVALSGDEKTVAETLGTGMLHVDELIVASGMSAQQVLTALTMLEIKGYAVRSANGKWKIEV